MSMSKFSSFIISYYLFLLPLSVSSCSQQLTQTVLKRSNWIPSNTQLLIQPIDLKHCIDQNQILHQRTSHVQRIGVTLHPLSVRTQSWEQLMTQQTPYGFQADQVGVSLIPYLIDNAEQKFFLLPRLPTSDFNRFLPACEPHLAGLETSILKMPYYYPTLILTVAPEQRSQLVHFLKTQLTDNCLWGELTATPLLPQEPLHQKSLSRLLTPILNTQQAEFLKQFPQKIRLNLPGTELHFTLEDKPSAQPTPRPQTQKVKITLMWPQNLGPFAIAHCNAAQLIQENYVTDCLLNTSIHHYYVKLTPVTPEPATANQRLLIVISLSAALEQAGLGKVIQDTLYQVFNQRQKITRSFTLLAIGSGRQLSHPLLTSETLPDLQIDNTADTLKAQLKQLQFSAHDLNALDDLELVDVYMTQEQLTVDEVFYITDNMHLVSDPPRKQLGVPLAWHQDGIQLTVLTTQTCQFWHQRTQAQCINWQHPQKLTELLTQRLITE